MFAWWEVRIVQRRNPGQNVVVGNLPFVKQVSNWSTWQFWTLKIDGIQISKTCGKKIYLCQTKSPISFSPVFSSVWHGQLVPLLSDQCHGLNSLHFLGQRCETPNFVGMPARLLWCCQRKSCLGWLQGCNSGDIFSYQQLLCPNLVHEELQTISWKISPDFNWEMRISLVANRFSRSYMGMSQIGNLPHISGFSNNKQNQWNQLCFGFDESHLTFFAAKMGSS